MGVRANGQGLDLNRDFVKLEAPETRGLVKVMNEWNPDLFLDLHMTNGSYHRYTITYQGPKNPAGDAGVMAFCRDALMPGAGAFLKAKDGFESFFYGNFDKDHKLWTTYGATPRFGTTYVGVRGRLSVLSESYSYATFKDRVIGSRDFARGVLQFAVEHADEAKQRSQSGGGSRALRPRTSVSIRSEATVAKEKVTILGFVEEPKGGHMVPTAEPKEYVCGFEQEFVPTLSVRKPAAYLVPAKFSRGDREPQAAWPHGR